MPRAQPRRLLAQDAKHPLALDQRRNDRLGFGTH
jgi:hypothetical protein